MDVTVKSFYTDTMDLIKEQAIEMGAPVEDVLSDFLVDYLKMEGIVTSPELISCEKKDSSKGGYYKMSGFDYSDETGILDLFITSYFDKEDLPEFTKTRYEKCHNALYRFFMACVENDLLLNEYKENDPDLGEVIEMIRSEYKKKNISLVRFFVLTNGVVKNEAEVMEDLTIGLNSEIPLEEVIWDIKASMDSDLASRQDPFVDVDLENLFQPLECLPCDENSEVKSYLAVMPAMVLAQIYSKYHVRLLNQNVRNYLGGRKAINKNMLETIRKNPGRFFAYNNGLSSTAYKVHVATNDEGKLVIKGMDNWSIVNGGQTTNVIYYIYTQKKERDLLQGVNVSLKVTEIKIPDESEKKQTISNIARFANSQNQVKESDFAVNEPYMHTLKELSLKEIAPQSSKRAGTKWFFIRMRGEYEDAKTSRSVKKQREFLKECPKSQVLEKTDVAKLEMAWSLLPHVSCAGGEKCFEKFWKTVDKNEDIVVDEKYFHNLIAKMIIVQKIDELFKASGQKGYGNIIQFYSLASVSLKGHGKFDLEYIWNHQEVQPSLVPILSQCVEIVANYIKKIASDGNNVNISSAAKKADFWKAITLRLGSINDFDNSLLVVGGKEDLTTTQKAELSEFDSVPKEAWLSLAQWGRVSRKLSLLERKKVEHVAVALEKDKDVSYNYAIDVMAIYTKSKNMGWTM